MTRNVARRPATYNQSLILDALRHTCPKCLEDPGAMCRRQDGRLMQAPHSLRYAQIPT